jgi:hypothetical protein
VPNEHAENEGTRKRRHPEEPSALDPLENDIRQERPFHGVIRRQAPNAPALEDDLQLLTRRRLPAKAFVPEYHPTHRSLHVMRRGDCSQS